MMKTKEKRSVRSSRTARLRKSFESQRFKGLSRDYSLPQVEADQHQLILDDYKTYLGGVSKEDYVALRTECGCTTCDCDALSQDSYHRGCHTFGLFDQENDMTNSSESGGNYDEAIGYRPQKNQQREEDFEFYSIAD